MVIILSRTLGSMLPCVTPVLPEDLIRKVVQQKQVKGEQSFQQINVSISQLDFCSYFNI